MESVYEKAVKLIVCDDYMNIDFHYFPKEVTNVVLNMRCTY